MEDDAIAHHQDKQYPHGHKILDPHSKKDHHHSHHHHHHHGNHHNHHKHCHGNHNPECKGAHHISNHNGRHHHGSHISRLLYHSQKPHTDTIAEVVETNTSDEVVPLNATSRKTNNGKNTCVSKCSKNNVSSSKVRSEPTNDGSRRASSSIGIPNRYSDIPNRNDHLPDISSLITLESAVTSPLYADEPVLDTNHRDLTVRDVEDILGTSPRTRGIFSGKSGKLGTSPSKSPHTPKYKLEDIIDDVSLDIGTPWREDTVPMIDFKNTRPVDRYDNNFLFQSVH